jgi:hypothetical protein
VVEVQTRLQKLYPNLCFFHMPAQHMLSTTSVDPLSGLSSSQELPQKTRFEGTQLSSKEIAPQKHENGGSQTKCTPVAAQEAVRRRGKRPRETAAPDASSKDGSMTAECLQFVANAVIAGDTYQWHVDADPNDLPPNSRWVHQFGLYPNRVLPTTDLSACVCALSASN